MQRNPAKAFERLGRREFIQGSTLCLAGVAAAVNPMRQMLAGEETSKPELRIGLITDLHFAEKNSADDRCYREALDKLADAAKIFDESRVDLVVALGDLIDSAPTLDAEKGYLRQVKQAFARHPQQHHFVVGNHCVLNLTKSEFLEIAEQKKSYYSFDVGGRHFVVLDACFRSDGEPYGRANSDWTDANIPAAEIEWLRDDLKQTPHKTIAFAHQCLDIEAPLGVKNAGEIRKVLEDSGKVLAVLQGHHHEGNYHEIHGIHYCTLKAAVVGAGLENNAFAMLDLLPGNAMRLTGFRRQPSYQWG